MKKMICIVFMIALFTSSFTVFAAEYRGVLPSGTAYSDVEGVIDAYVEEHKATTAAVSVAVFTGSEVLMGKAYGYSDIENGIVNNKDTVFEWGSATKLLTWTSIMQLVEKDSINLNEDIRKYLPEGFLKKLRFDTPITMLNLMNHNAGWQEVATDLWIEDAGDVRNLGDALKLVEPEQVNQPGTVVAYSNWGSALAAYIVECVSGQPFDDYVHEHIFKPLDMENTALNATLSDNEWVKDKRREVKCYTTENRPLGTCIYNISLYPAGKATGTLDDFIKFGQAFLAPSGEKSPLFEKSQTLGEMLSPSLLFSDGTTPRNSHGFWTDEFGVSVLWHNGGTLGSSSWFAFDPKSGTGMIILTNQFHESVYNCGLLPKVFGKYEGEIWEGAAGDISGIYMPAKNFFKGFAKPYSLFSNIQFVSDGKDGYTVPGPDYTVKHITEDSYLLDMGGLKQDIVYKSTDKNGRTVLQLPGVDYIEINGYGVIAQFALLGIFILAALYGFLSLVTSCFSVLRRKKTNGITEGYRNIINASVVLAAALSGYLSENLFSNSPLRKEILWSIILIGILTLVSVSCILILALKWKSFNCARKEKRRLIMACTAGIIMIANVIFWQTYKFW